MSGERKCPVCETVGMVEIRIGDQLVDRCPSCRGLYFDSGELEALVDLMERFSRVELEEDEIDTIPEAEVERELHCPVDGARMREKDVGNGFIIDVCEKCKGIWLDDGELNAIKILEKHVRENIKLYIRLGQ